MANQLITNSGRLTLEPYQLNPLSSRATSPFRKTEKKLVKEHRSRKKEAVASSSSFSKWVFGKLRDGNHIHSLARAQSAFSTELVAHIRLQEQKTAFYSIIHTEGPCLMRLL